MTHDHAEDFALCDAALRLPQPLGGIGLIGSSAKWTRFAAQLAAAGHAPEAIARITCPIGQPGITGKDPAIIAIAIAAALLPALPPSSPASQRAAASPGLRSDEGATREGDASRRPGGERDNRASQRAAGAAWTDERRRSEEGRRRLKGGPEASGTAERAGQQSERDSRASGKTERANE